MKHWLFSLFGFLFKLWAKKSQRDLVSEFKAKSLIGYLRILNGVRLGAMGMVTVLIVFQMVGLGLAMMIGAAVFLAQLTLEVKLWAVFGLGTALFLLPVLGLCILLSERVWYRASGADKLVREILEKNS